jgi:hypothetical protein
MAPKQVDVNIRRYNMLKQVYMENRLKRQTIDSIWFQYMEQLNKAVYPHELDSVLDAIIENERRLGKNV